MSAILSSSTSTHRQLNCLTIDCRAIGKNLEQLKAHLPGGVKIMAMIKSGAYGIGDPFPLTDYLERKGIDIFGLAYTSEALSLRESGSQSELVVMAPLLEDAPFIAKYELQAVVSDETMIDQLAREAKNPIKVHLHINTGMNRLGCRVDHAAFLAEKIAQNPKLKLEGVMTHFSCAEDPEQDPFTYKQIQAFHKCLSALRALDVPMPYIHTSNSAGALRFHQPECNLVRLGLSLYGFHLSSEMERRYALTPALSLTSTVIGLHICDRGETVSYGRTYQVKKKSAVIAVIPLGYHDGLHRNYSNKGHVYIRGIKAPLVGNICMDQAMVDVSHIPGVAIGDDVMIFGSHQSPAAFAGMGGTIAHELISCLGPRITRRFVGPAECD